MVEVSIKLRVKDGVEVDLTVDEAQQLAQLLDVALGRGGIQVWPVYPVPTYPQPYIYPYPPTFVSSGAASIPSVLSVVDN